MMFSPRQKLYALSLAGHKSYWYSVAGVTRTPKSEVEPLDHRNQSYAGTFSFSFSYVKFF